MNKDPYDITPVPQKDIFTYTDMTEEDFENLVDNLFFEHAKKIDGPWAEEEVLDFEKIYHFACDLRAVLAAANGPLQATTSKPLPVIPWSGSNLTEMEELLQKVQQLETENAEINEKLDSKRNTIRSLCEKLDSLKRVSIENQRLTIVLKHLQENRPQSEMDAAHLATENVLLNANFARYISATQDTEKQNERLASMVRELQDENVALREELQQSEDRFRNIPDEVWSKADLVEMTNKALEERDDAYKQNAALREKAERYRLVTLRQDADNTALCNKLAALENQTQWECSCGGTDCEGQKENAALRKLVQHWYKLVPENIRSSIEDAQKETKP